MLKPCEIGNKCAGCDIKVRKNILECMKDSNQIILDI